MTARQTTWALPIGAGILVFLGACTPTCTEAQLQAPVGLDPNGELDVLDPSTLATFAWGYPVSSCEPDFFEMYVWKGLEPASPGMKGRVNYSDEVSPGSWHLQWPVYLEPGNTYFWRVCAGLEAGPGDDPCGPAALGHFYTGPECTAGDAMQPVDLLSPEDEATFAVGDDVTFAWDDPTACLVSYTFWIQISDSPDFTEYLRRIPVLQSVFTVPGDEIPLEDCTRYYWRIKTDPAGPPEEPFSETRSFFVQSPGVICPPAFEPGPIVTIPVPPVEPVVPTPTGVPEPMVTAPLDSNCRAGPSTLYDVDDTLFAGVTAPIKGRNEDATWLQILSPNLRRLCWVWAGQAGIQIVGDPLSVPIVRVAPPEPTEVPVDCSDYSTENACQANAACKWVPYATRVGGTCQKK
ncbi:MAG TPA: hypothetical protein VFI11_14730 [Anaerolineales bacterium]|nr:hypothetical protein [Anaerolineales bacterium]